MNLESYAQVTIQWLVTSGVRVLLILIMVMVALKFCSIVANRLSIFVPKGKRADPEFTKRVETLTSVVRYALAAVVMAAALMMIMGEIGIEIGPILAAAGVVGLAVGFGAQNLVQDVIGGFFILLDDEVRVGDIVEVAGKGGLVERVNLRMIVLRDLAGNVHYVRNGYIDVVTNLTKDFSRYVFDIGVAYQEDVDEVISVIREVDEQLRADPEFSGDILEPIEVLGLDQFADSAIVIKARTTTKPNRQFATGREFNRRLKKRFDELNIEIPFPHLTLYAGSIKKGKTPALHLLVQQDSSQAGDHKNQQAPGRDVS